jgi:hypothetical protein
LIRPELLSRIGDEHSLRLYRSDRRRRWKNVPSLPPARLAPAARVVSGPAARPARDTGAQPVHGHEGSTARTSARFDAGEQSLFGLVGLDLAIPANCCFARSPSFKRCAAEIAPGECDAPLKWG